jgi:hypothetical protein
VREDTLHPLVRRSLLETAAAVHLTCNERTLNVITELNFGINRSQQSEVSFSAVVPKL